MLAVSRSAIARARKLLGESLRARLLRRSLKRLRSIPAGTLPAPALLEATRLGWGNTAYSADVRFLTVMLRLLASTPGPVLECGSGLSTILLGLAARNLTVWSLEHDRDWFDRVNRKLRHEQIDTVRLLFTRLRRYTDYDWYDVPHRGMPRDFSLVVCDGPPESTHGGRYGLLPFLHDHLAPGALVLLDDANTETGQSVLHRWQVELGAVSEVSVHEHGSYAVVRPPIGFAGTSATERPDRCQGPGTFSSARS